MHPNHVPECSLLALQSLSPRMAMQDACRGKKKGGCGGRDTEYTGSADTTPTLLQA